MKWNDDRELEEIITKDEEIIEKINDIITKINEINQDKAITSNVGISYNKKILEIYNSYKVKNMTFYNSKLYLLVRSYLETLLKEAINSLDQYATFLKNLPCTNHPYLYLLKNGLKLKKEKAEAEGFIDNYQKINKQLINFDIDKDILTAFETDVDLWNKREQEGDFNYYKDIGNEGICEINKDLERLGCTSRLPQIYENEKSIEQTNVTNQNRRLNLDDTYKKIQAMNKIIDEIRKQTQLFVTNEKGEILDVSNLSLSEIEHLQQEGYTIYNPDEQMKNITNDTSSGRKTL